MLVLSPHILTVALTSRVQLQLHCPACMTSSQHNARRPSSRGRECQAQKSSANDRLGCTSLSALRDAVQLTSDDKLSLQDIPGRVVMAIDVAVDKVRHQNSGTLPPALNGLTLFCTPLAYHQKFRRQR